MENSRFDERVEAFADYYSQKIYDSIPSLDFVYKEEQSVAVIRQFMLIFLEQCITTVAPIEKGT